MKVLIVYGSFGSGHRRAAEAVLEAFQDCGIAAETRDLLEFLPAPMSKLYSGAYEFMITRSRSLWRLTYNLVNAPRKPYAPAKEFTQKWQFSRLKRYFQEGRFTHAVCTHFTPAALFTDWQSMGEVHCKTFSIITDHESHRCWKRTGLDHYFVASSAVADEMMQIGIPEKDITVSGIPISKTFTDRRPREEIRNGARSALQLLPYQTLVLVLCSAITVKKGVQMLSEFQSIQTPPLHYLVVSGSSAKRERVFKERFGKRNNFTIFGFTGKIAELMKASDLIVTKPGGLIVSEALAAGLPQLLLEPIPGQEEANARYAIEEGAAIPLKERKGEYAKTLMEVLEHPAKLQQMSEAARKAARPEAASQIVETILSRFVV